MNQVRRTVDLPVGAPWLAPSGSACNACEPAIGGQLGRQVLLDQAPILGDIASVSGGAVAGGPVP